MCVIIFLDIKLYWFFLLFKDGFNEMKGNKQIKNVEILRNFDCPSVRQYVRKPEENLLTLALNSVHLFLFWPELHEYVCSESDINKYISC